MIKRLFTSNWISKLVSLFIAIAVWFMIHSHLEREKLKNNRAPIPGTQIPIPQSSDPPVPPNPLVNP